MENGHRGGGDLVHKFSALAVSGAGSDSSSNNKELSQVLKAVEDPEAIIKHQKVDGSKVPSPHSDNHWDDNVHVPQKAHQLVPQMPNQADGSRSMVSSSRHNPSGATALQKDLTRHVGDPPVQAPGESHFKSSKISGSLEVLPGGQIFMNTHAFHFVRHHIEGEDDPRSNTSREGLMPLAEVKNHSSPLKQDLAAKIRDYEEEILQLRKHNAEYSVKEAQVQKEKYVLEQRIAYMRMAFDQQQQELVDAASKAISYRQDIIEENIRLTYALQEAQEDRSVFVSSLMPILAEYSPQPPVAGAQSIVSNLKVLFKHLQEKLIITESKLKELQYQLAPWRSDTNFSNFSQSPARSVGKNIGLELVPQQAYSNGHLTFSPEPQTTTDWDITGPRQRGSDGGASLNPEPNAFGRYSPLINRNNASQDLPAQLRVSQGDSHTRYSEDTTSKQVTFSDPVSSIEMDGVEMEGDQNGRVPSVSWGSKNSSYTTTLDDPSSSYSPYLPPVLEEPSSSFSEAADDDPLPAVESLQIAGEAFPGWELQASGYSINGTTSCNFEWVRHMEDGSFKYIEGAKHPNYLVSADDIGICLAIEGDLVKVFANENKKITCDPDMHSHVKKTLSSGHASYRVSLATGYHDMWEPATLAIKREGYSINCSGRSAVLITEKFSPATIVTCGNPSEFSIIDAGGEHLLRSESILTDISSSRDTIVCPLTLSTVFAWYEWHGVAAIFFMHSYSKNLRNCIYFFLFIYEL
ncbi:hypothetical protein RJ639_043683 [Escallonia herrerae]|uniref:Uncharacterized protein n=1 Tax=Escallonia herrerae TaxID=1293975 RepID=A0AA88WB69_9ASTE|nr:hypothetical protein RJ639_043683 [Escallonia herrerae]